MLASLLARFGGDGVREVNRYAAWSLALEQFRAARKINPTPSRGEIEVALANVPMDQRADAIEDLLAEILFNSWSAGRGPTLDNLEFALPDRTDRAVAASRVWSPGLIEDEFLARQRVPHGDHPGVDEYERRFPGRADVLERLRARQRGGGRFVLLRCCGIGAVGCVWEAYDRDRGVCVALKEPRWNLPAVERVQVATQFAAEAETTAPLTHDGIAALRVIGKENGSPVFGMPLVTGESLGARVREYHAGLTTWTRRERRAREHELIEAFLTVANVVAHAHDNGVLHRDLTPSNVVLDRSGRTFVLDWGSATRAGVETKARRREAGSPIGTPEYMAPEQVDGKADERSDVFGLGAILFEILTGRPPRTWPGEVRPANWCERVRTFAMVSPRAVNPAASRRLARICVRALAPDPRARPPSAAALREEVRAWLARERRRRWWGW